VRHNANADSIRQALSGISTLGGSKNAYGNTTVSVDTLFLKNNN
jgi:hypothetical protein